MKKIFCKQCAINFFQRKWLDLRIAFHTDTKIYDIFTGFLLIFWAIIFFIGEPYVVIGGTFGKVFEITSTLKLNEEIWATTFLVLGISRLISSICCIKKIRSVISLIILYFWILILYYIVIIPPIYAIAVGLFGLLVLYSAVTFIMLCGDQDGLH